MTILAFIARHTGHQCYRESMLLAGGGGVWGGDMVRVNFKQTINTKTTRGVLRDVCLIRSSLIDN